MGKDTNIFQIIVLGVFIAIGVGAVIAFSTIRSESDENLRIPIVIWGTLNETNMRDLLRKLREEQGGFINVSYVQFSPSNFYPSLVDALASGTGPDLFLVEHSEVLPQWSKLTIIPYDRYTEATFRNTYIQAADLFLVGSGVVGIPFMVDPLVMYWNEDMFYSAGIPNPPQYWDEIYALIPKLTTLSDDLRIEKSTIAFGEFGNVTNATAVLSALMLQAGTPIVQWQRSGLETALADDFNLPTAPGEAALRFYTQFSDPVKISYSWSKSMPNSRDAFLAGDLAIYIGFASEATVLANTNPNLNFALATLPQSKAAARRSTYARMYALAIPKNAKNAEASFSAALGLTTAASMRYLSEFTGLPSVRRDMLASGQGSSYWTIANESALIAESWLEPGRKNTDSVFERMVDSVTSGGNTAASAIGEADARLNQLLGG